jgi:FkbM family methyltransferase
MKQFKHKNQYLNNNLLKNNDSYIFQKISRILLNKNSLYDFYLKIIRKMSKGYGFGKNPFVRKVLKKTKIVLKPEFTIIDNQKMYLDKWDSLDLLENRVYGELDTKIVKKIVKTGDIVLDLGANIGYFTILFAKLVGINGKVIAFEPELKNFKILKKNISENKFNNVILENKAVSDKNGMSVLFTGTKSSGANRIYEPKKAQEWREKEKQQEFEKKEIETVSIDTFLIQKKIKYVNFIKMDIEGGEFFALKGMKDVLKNPDLKIFMEWDRPALEDSGIKPLEVLELLKQENFIVYYVHDKKNKLELADEKKLLTSDTYKIKTINLLCTKKPYDLEF